MYSHLRHLKRLLKLHIYQRLLNLGNQIDLGMINLEILCFDLKAS